jgi:hypothetical protein
MKSKIIIALLALVLLGFPMEVLALDLPSPYTVTTTSGSNGFDNPFVSSDGRYVAFTSSSPNVLPNDNNGVGDAFRKDILTGQTVRINTTDPNGVLFDVYNGTVNGLSDDGSKVLFRTNATFDQNDTNNNLDLYIKDLNNNTISLVSNICGLYCTSGFMTPDANIVVYASYTSYGSDPIYYKRNMLTGSTEQLSLPGLGITAPRAISADGRFIAYEDNYPIYIGSSVYRQNDIKLYDTVTGTSDTVNVSPEGNQANHTRSEGVSISNDGRYVSFLSYASNLVSGDTNDKEDVFTRDMLTGVTERDSVRSNGTESNANSQSAQISSDGKYVLFTTPAYLVDPAGTGILTYVRDRLNGVTKMATPLNYPALSNGYVGGQISSDDMYTVFGTAGALTLRSLSDIMADNTPPQIQPVYSLPPNSDGWWHSTVQLSWNISDSESSIVNSSGCEPISVNSETSVTGNSYTCTATSSGGTSAQTAIIKFDATAPTISYSYSKLPNFNGWNNTDVTLTASCNDGLSGVALCSGPMTFQSDGDNQHFSATATDKAGNTSALGPILIKIDKTLPGATFAGSTLVIKGLNQTMTGSASDITSGVAKVEISDGTTTISNQSEDITLSCDNGNHNCTWVASPSKLASGIKTLTLKVTDLADNVYTTTKQYIIL